MSNYWKKYLQLQKKRKRQEEKKFIVEGSRLCQEALASGWDIEIAFISTDFSESAQWEVFREKLGLRNITWQVLQNQQLKRLSDTETPQGILMIMKMPSYRMEKTHWEKAGWVVLLQGVRDPGNLGTLIRTADWYGAGAVILSYDCVEPFNPKVLRGSMGSLFHLPVFSVRDMVREIEQLKRYHFEVVTAALTGKQPLHKTTFKRPVALILGGEARGVSPELQQYTDLTIRIWKYGNAESLNVAVAGGILMNHIAEHVFPTK